MVVSLDHDRCWRRRVLFLFDKHRKGMLLLRIHLQFLNMFTDNVGCVLHTAPQKQKLYV